MTRGLTCLALLLAAGSVPAQPESEPPVRVTIRPRAEPEPALKYLLLPELGDQMAGNAALFYHRAMHMRSQLRQAPEEDMKVGQEWFEVPLKEFPRDEVRKLLARYKNVLHEVDLGARRRHCDWGLDFRTEGIGLLLPEIQGMRSLVSLVALQARLETAEGHYDQAVHTLQTGFALARHVGEGQTLIQFLVGLASAGVMTQRTEELIQARGAPNLYWALTELPRPLIDLREPLQGEKVFLFREFPQLRTLTNEQLTPQQLQKLVDSGFLELAQLEGTRMASWEVKLGVTASTAKYYPQAKRFLKAQGKTQEQIEAMPALQAVMIYSLYQYDRQRDDQFKWLSVPYWQARAGLQKAEKGLKRSKASMDEGFPIGPLLLPAVQKVFFASARSERRIAALRCIEAVRLYAAAHDGKLPESLDEITEVPVPIDPVTGKAFDYKLAEGKAALVGPPPSGEAAQPGNNTVRYELSVAH